MANSDSDPTRSPAVAVIHLDSDGYSPNSQPHALPALHYRGAYLHLVHPQHPSGERRGGAGGEAGFSNGSIASTDARTQVETRGWAPSWQYGMYTQPHYHTTTHELLLVLSGTATILLGGTDLRAKPPPPPPASPPKRTQYQLDLGPGDVLLIPAGYTHRALASSDEFAMLGSYPPGAERWNMRYPNVNGCRYDIDEIARLVGEKPRKALFAAQDPVKRLGKEKGEGMLQQTWFHASPAVAGADV